MPFEDKNPVVSGSSLLIVDDDGNSVASIDSSGTGSFQNLTSVGSPEFYGLDLRTGIIDPLPRGLIAEGYSDTYNPPGGFIAEVGLLEVAAQLDNRNYTLYGQINAQSQGGAGNSIGLNIRYTYSAGGTASKPSLASTMIFQVNREINFIGINEKFEIQIDSDLPAGHYRFLLTVQRSTGSGLMAMATSAITPLFFSLKDNGPAGRNTGVINAGGGGGGAPVQSYVSSYFAIWSKPYKSNNAQGSFSVSDGLYQGYNDSTSGNRRSMAGFDWATIQSALSGATITACTVRLYFQHWYNYSGGTAYIGYHNDASGSPPGTFSGNIGVVGSSGWPNPGLRYVDMGSSFGDLFRTGAAKGVVIGPGADNGHLYYGYAAGASASPDIRPMITFYYTK